MDRLFRALKARPDWWKNLVWAVASLALVAIFIAAEISHLRAQVTVGNLDFFTMAARVNSLSHDPTAWVSGFYPVGIPLALRLGLVLGLDVVRTGQAVSTLGGVLCLCSGVLLAWQLTHSRVIALLTMIALLATGTIMFYSGYEGTDMLAAGLQALALSILACNPRGQRVAFIAGFVNGVGYLARYTALVMLLVCLAYLAAIGLYRREGKQLWILPALYGSGFLIGSLPQTIPSLLLKGNPFYQTQAYHIWIKLYANNDFVRSLWSTPPVEITLWRLFWTDPCLFLANWQHEFARFWLTLDVPLVDQPLVQLARAGLLFAVLDAHRLDIERRALLAFFVVGVVTAVSIFTIDTRFLIMLTPTLAVCGLYFPWRLLPLLKIRVARLPLNVLGPVVIVALMVPAAWDFAHTQEGGPHAAVIRTSNMLHAAGAGSASQILSTNLYHQDVASPTRDRFGMLYAFDAPATTAGLRQQALASGYRFLIYTAEGGPTYHPQYQDLLQPETRFPGYTPIWVPEDRHLIAYRLEPDMPSPRDATQISLANGVVLIGYDVLTSTDQPTGESRIGLYLYWQTIAPLTESLKVFVHLVDVNGDLVVQHDAIPALWTYPTSSWAVGETVIDYHSLSSTQRDGPYTIHVGLYDAGTGQRVPVLGVDGAPPSDHILLETLTFD